MCLQESDTMVLHQIGHAQGGGAAHAGVAVHQRASAVRHIELDLLCHLVKVLAEWRPRGVGDGDVEVLHFGSRGAIAFGLGNVNDACYLAPSHLEEIISRSAVTEIKMVGDLTQAWEANGSLLMHKHGEVTDILQGSR